MAMNKLPDARDLELLRTRMSTQFQIPSAYDDALSYQGLIYKLIQYLKDTMQNVEDWNVWLEDFVSTFDEKLGDTVRDTVQQFIDDGSIQVIISEALQWELDDYIATNEQDKLSLTAQLEQTKGRTHITPDDFSGTDLEKLQQVFDYAIENNIETIDLTRSYDITGGSIYFPEESNYPFSLLMFRGGEIIKNDEGYVFDCVTEDNRRNSPQFFGTKFTTEIDTNNGTYLYNGDRMIRQSVTNCLFHRMGLVHSNSYLQTLRVINCETGQLSCDFISGKMAYDFEMAFHRGESSSKVGAHLINVKTDKTTDISFMSFRILNSLVEGYAQETPIVLGTGYGLKIDGLYCEANKTSIRFEKGVGVDRLSGSISNSIFTQSLGDFEIEFVGVTNYAFLKLSNITSNVSSGKTLSNATNPRLITDNINLYGGGKISKATRQYKQYLNFPVTQQNLGAGGISFEVRLQTEDNLYLHNQFNKQFIFNAKFTYGSSAYYSAHLTGILTMDGYYNTEIVYGLNVDVLSTRNTSGNINGNLENPVTFDYYFKESGTKTLPANAESATVVFTFEKGVYNASPNVNHLTFKPINELLGEGSISV